MRDFTRYDFSPKKPGKNSQQNKKVPSWVRWMNRAILLALIVLIWHQCFKETEQGQQAPSLANVSSSAETTEPAEVAEATGSSGKENSSGKRNSADTTIIAETGSATNTESLDDEFAAEGNISPEDQREPDESMKEVSSPNSMDAGWLAMQKDTLLAKRLRQLLKRYKPDGAFYLLTDPANNEILAWGQRKNGEESEAPTLLNYGGMPAASLIKILSAAAAMEYKRYGAASKIPLIGHPHKLYKDQLVIPRNYSGITVSLEDAFARSINPVFGIIGQQLGGKRMKAVADQLGFNRSLTKGNSSISHFNPPQSGYEVAEAASGFTTANTISPLHTAGIIRSILSGEGMSVPWSKKIPEAWAPDVKVSVPATSLSLNTRYGMKRLMERTVTHGTAKNSLRKTVFSYNLDKLDIGGKTGTLDGFNPEKARYEWFAGFAEYKKDPSQAIIFVVIQYHKDKRTLNTVQITGLILNTWAKHRLVKPSS